MQGQELSDLPSPLPSMQECSPTISANNNNTNNYNFLENSANHHILFQQSQAPTTVLPHHPQVMHVFIILDISIYGIIKIYEYIFNGTSYLCSYLIKMGKKNNIIFREADRPCGKWMSIDKKFSISQDSTTACFHSIN